MKERRQSNSIGSIISDGVLKEMVGDVKEEVRRYFSEKFVEMNFNRSCLDGIPFMKISLEDQFSLEVPFVEAEVKEAV